MIAPRRNFPNVLMGNGACNSAVDPTYAPADGHSAFWWPFAPYAIGGDPQGMGSRQGANTPSASSRVAGVCLQS